MRGLVRSAYEKYVERIGREPEPMIEDYATVLADAQVWVAESTSGTLVGALVVYAETDHLLVSNLAVAPTSQSTGLGSTLLRLAEAHAMQLGLAQVRLYTHIRMTENIGFYARRGYRETHRGGQHGYERVFFTKTLGVATPR